MDEDLLIARIRSRLQRINRSASAFTEALGLPPEAKDKVISRMALGERQIPSTVTGLETHVVSDEPLRPIAAGPSTTHVRQWIEGALPSRFIQLIGDVFQRGQPASALVPVSYTRSDPSVGSPTEHEPRFTIGPVSFLLIEGSNEPDVTVVLMLESTAAGPAVVRFFRNRPDPGIVVQDDDAPPFAHEIVLSANHPEDTITLPRTGDALFARWEIEVDAPAE